MLTTWWGGEPEIEIPIARRQATAIYASRSDARARIAKSSPTLQHSESWLETLVSLHEYMPPGVWWIVNALTSCLTLADIWFSGDGAGFDGDTWWRIPSHAHNTLLGLLSLLLAFRTSQAYDRWWEARKLWGQIVNSTRNIASNAAIFMTSLERKRDVIKATICFAWCTKASLRGVRPTADELRELTTDEMRRNMVRPYPGPPERRPTLHLTEKEAYDEMIKSSPAETFEHLPMMMIDEIKSGIRDELEQHAIEKGASETHEGWKIVLGADIKALVDALGGCERIQKTPMPFGYLAQQRIFMLLWLVTYPLAIASAYKWWTIPVTAGVSFIMLKVDAIGVEIEHPFGASPHDLPLEHICITIEKNLLEILRRAESRELRLLEDITPARRL